MGCSDQPVVSLASVRVVVHQNIPDFVVAFSVYFDGVAFQTVVEIAGLQVERRPLLGNVDQ